MLKLDASMLALDVSQRCGLELKPCSPPPNVAADVALGSVDPSPERGLCVCVSLALGRLTVRVTPGIFAQGLLAAVNRELSDNAPALIAVARHLVDDGYEVAIGGKGVGSTDSLMSADEVFPVVVSLPYIASSGSDHDQVRIVASTVMKALGMALIAVPHSVAGSATDSAGDVEGLRLDEVSVRIERSRANRMACIAIHGVNCAACGMRMSDRYGELARDLVEVHHLTPLASLGTPRPVDPRAELVPLCPNCHRVAHLATPPLSPAQIRESLLPNVRLSVDS